MAATPQVSMNPAILSGEPCLDGYRIPVYMIAELVWEHGVEEAVDLWSLTREDVLVVCWYAGAYGVTTLHSTSEDETYRRSLTNKVWLHRWRDWAVENHPAIWQQDYDLVIDPPLRSDKAVQVHA